MKTLQRVVFVAAVAGAAVGLTAPARGESDAKAEIGRKAPGFVLTDTAGKEVRLSDFTGKACESCNKGAAPGELKAGSCCDKAAKEGKACGHPCCKKAAEGGRIVVLQWINPGCPFCKRVAADLVNATDAKLKEIDKNVVHLMISTNHHLKAEPIAEYLKANKIENPGLIDEDGKVGKAYGAKSTPHVFIIDGAGVLRYSGAFDDDPEGTKGDKATNHVVESVKAIAGGKEVSPATTAPYGCGVKYKS